MATPRFVLDSGVHASARAVGRTGSTTLVASPALVEALPLPPTFTADNATGVKKTPLLRDARRFEEGAVLTSGSVGRRPGMVADTTLSDLGCDGAVVESCPTTSMSSIDRSSGTSLNSALVVICRGCWSARLATPDGRRSKRPIREETYVTPPSGAVVDDLDGFMGVRDETSGRVVGDDAWTDVFAEVLADAVALASGVGVREEPRHRTEANVEVRRVPEVRVTSGTGASLIVGDVAAVPEGSWLPGASPGLAVMDIVPGDVIFAFISAGDSFAVLCNAAVATAASASSSSAAFFRICAYQSSVLLLPPKPVHPPPALSLVIESPAAAPKLAKPPQPVLPMPDHDTPAPLLLRSTLVPEVPPPSVVWPVEVLNTATTWLPMLIDPDAAALLIIDSLFPAVDLCGRFS